jgi:hypothetical protein
MILNEEYLSSDAVSQSRLKKLLIHPQMFLNAQNDNELEEPKETTVIGDAVDIILTQNEDEFYNNFYVTDSKRPTGQMGDFVWHLYINKDKMDAEQIAYEAAGFKRDSLYVVRERFEKEGGRYYYESLVESEGKTTITSEQKAKIDNIVDSLRNNEWTSRWINGDEDIEIHKQVPLDFEYMGQKCKGLVDIIAIDKKTNKVYPIDIKTSSVSTNAWMTVFWKFRYDIQAAFYSYGIENSDVLERLGHKKKTRIMDFRFIVANQSFPKTPLIFQTTSDVKHLGTMGGKVEGKQYEGFHQAIERYKWHMENDLWDYPMEDYMNSGVRTISLKYG